MSFVDFDCCDMISMLFVLCLCVCVCVCVRWSSFVVIVFSLFLVVSFCFRMCSVVGCFRGSRCFHCFCFVGGFRVVCVVLLFLLGLVHWWSCGFVVLVGDRVVVGCCWVVGSLLVGWSLVLGWFLVVGRFLLGVLTCWLVGWLVGLVVWLVGWLVGWVGGRMGV